MQINSGVRRKAIKPFAWQSFLCCCALKF